MIGFNSYRRPNGQIVKGIFGQSNHGKNLHGYRHRKAQMSFFGKKSGRVSQTSRLFKF